MYVSRSKVLADILAKGWADKVDISFIPLGPELLSEAIGFLRKSGLLLEKTPLETMPAMILAIFGAKWNIDTASLRELGNYGKKTSLKPEWTEFQLPSERE